jgi:hypothetical protein
MEQNIYIYFYLLNTHFTYAHKLIYAQKNKIKKKLHSKKLRIHIKKKLRAVVGENRAAEK